MRRADSCGMARAGQDGRCSIAVPEVLGVLRPQFGFWLEPVPKATVSEGRLYYMCNNLRRQVSLG